MNKDMFIKDVFDYGKSQDWKYKGDNLPSLTCMPTGVVPAV